MNENELVKKAKSGDKEAFCRLYSLYKDRLYRYAYYRLGNVDDAQDAVSDCVVRAYEQIKNLRKAEAFPSWIFKILRAACSDYVKLQIKQRESESLDTVKSSSDLFVTIDESKTELRQALDTLSGDEREIVLLSVVAGFTSKEISKLTGLTAGSVRSKLSRSISKMRNFFGVMTNEEK
ncbi:MAG: RNA polymerase sigma factor [Eubacterium sp.]|nr:RNA polymerase sigma factor [Eubacterium sp.]